jgi:hypothetical protein
MTLEHAASETDIEEKQNEELLTGNRQILERVVGEGRALNQAPLARGAGPNGSGRIRRTVVDLTRSEVH